MAGFISCTNNDNTLIENTASVSRDLDEIIESGRLTAVTEMNSTDYFVYKGAPMGFYYEMLSAFASYLGVDLEIRTENDLEKSVELLNSGEVDICASGLTVSSCRRKQVLFSDPVIQTRQVLIQRKPRNWRNMTKEALDRQLIRNQLDLAHKTVYIKKNTVYRRRLLSLSEEIGDTINVIELPFSVETIIRGVASSNIDYAVADEHVAMVNASYYPDIDVSTPVSFVQNVAWGLRRNHSEKLAGELNKWLFSYRKTRSFALLYDKYFRNSRSNRIVNSDYYTITTGKISEWDDLIKMAGKEIGWDWRLLSSLIYQESHFDPDVVSWAGAFGLMQVMPVTGSKFGIDIVNASPAENVQAGIQYIQWLDSYFREKIPDDGERLKFVLGSYNAGPGHILDAMRLAEKNNMDPCKWDGNVAVWMLKKSDPTTYNDEVVKNGYARGYETVNYVSDILDRYEHYKNIITDDSGTKLSMNDSF